MALTTQKTLSICVIVFVCLSTPCTAMRAMAADAGGDSVRREIKPGDTVRVVIRDGSVHSFQVTVVGATSLGGDAVNIWKGGADPVGSRIDVAYSDIAELDVKRTSGGKTVGLIAVALLVVIAIASGGGSHQARYGTR